MSKKACKEVNELQRQQRRRQKGKKIMKQRTDDRSSYIKSQEVLQKKDATITHFRITGINKLSGMKDDQGTLRF